MIYWHGSSRFCFVGVVLGSEVSDWREVTSGVPQGSVLGSLLFIMYINYLPESVGGFCRLYADDNKIVSIIENMESVMRLQERIDAVSEWTDKWLVWLNAKKCVVMHLGRENLRANKLNYRPQHRRASSDV